MNSTIQALPDKRHLLELAFEMLFPTYDGSMTNLLEHCFETCIHVSLLFQGIVILETSQPALGLETGEQVLAREVLLQHGNTGKNLLYAFSLLAPRVVPQSFLKDVERKDAPQPLGKLFQDIPVRRQILSSQKRFLDEQLAHYFLTSPQSSGYSRTMLLSFEKGPALLIKEVIPCQYSEL